MKRFLHDTLVYLSFVGGIFAVTYMMIYAWDKEAEYQEKKEKEYYENIYRG